MAVVSHVSPVLHIYELDTETKEEEKKPELVSATMDRDTVWCVSLPPFSDTTSLQLHHGHMLVVDMCCTLRSLIGDISEDVGCHYRTYMNYCFYYESRLLVFYYDCLYEYYLVLQCWHDLIAVQHMTHYFPCPFGC
jgi:hypothetical protein